MPKSKNNVKKVVKPGKAMAKKHGEKKKTASVAIDVEKTSKSIRSHTRGDTDTKCHREMVREFMKSDLQVAGQYSAFPLFHFPLNPGMKTTFPWLFPQAPSYETFKFKRLSFEWVPACPTDTAGVVTMAVDFDPVDPAPSSIVGFANYQGAVRGDVWAPHICKANLHDSRNPGEYRFVRTELSAEAVQDIALYDLGNLFLSITGIDDDLGETRGLGALYVDYEIEFKTPQINEEFFENVFEGRKVWNEGSYFYQDTSDGMVHSLPVGTSEAPTDIEQAMLDGVVWGPNTAEYVRREDGDSFDGTPPTIPISPGSNTWPISFHEDVYTAVDCDPQQDETWTRGFQALADVSLEMEVGFRSADIFLIDTPNSKKKLNAKAPEVPAECLGYWMTEVAMFDEERRQMLQHATTDTHGSNGGGLPTSGGGYWVATLTSGEGVAVSDAHLDLKFTCPRGCWVVWHTITAEYSTGTSHTPLVTASTKVTPSGGEGNDDIPWWETALKCIPIVGGIIQAILSIVLLPASLQQEVRDNIYLTQKNLLALEKQGRYCSASVAVAHGVALKARPRSIRVLRFLEMMNPLSPNSRHAIHVDEVPVIRERSFAPSATTTTSCAKV